MSRREKPSALDTMVREARESRDPGLDWSKVDASLFSRVERADREAAALARFSGAVTPWRIATGALALAAAVVLGLARGERATETPLDALERASAAAAVGAPAGRLAARLGGGAVILESARGNALAVAAKVEAQVQDVARAGALLQTADARAVFVATSRATWMMEESTQLRIVSGAPIILRLEEGAVEADVVPVAAGEAFAIDVGDMRVAVHGTHLRVAKNGSRATVDLTQGVVSIGSPPRRGSTYGALFIAPAHIEFSVEPVMGDHGPEATQQGVREALDLGAIVNASLPAASVALGAGSAATAHPRPPVVIAPAGPLRLVSPPDAASSAAPETADPEGALAAAVRACAANAIHPTNVSVTLESNLLLTVGDDGLVRMARFDPPLSPEIQTCASSAIYKAHFAHPGAKTIPLILAR